VIELVPDEEGAATQTREQMRAWLEDHQYKVVTIPSAAVEADLPKVLDALADVVAAAG
jgi:hypothetical protein